jgi:DNA polymerase I
VGFETIPMLVCGRKGISVATVDRLIYGKSEIQRIVSIEVEEDKAVLFCEMPDGEVVKHEVSNRFWMLSDKPQYPQDSWRKLKGELHYKWGRQFKKRDDFLQARYRSSGDLFSIYDPKESLMVKDGYTYFKGMKHNEVSVLAVDIESAGLVLDDTSDVYLIACTLRKHGVISRRMFCYDEYESRFEMFEAFCNYVRSEDPSVIIGHNIFGYDLPYMAHVAKMYGAVLMLGRNGSAVTFEKNESKFRKDGSQFIHYHRAHIYGREIVDTMFLAIKYDVGRKYASYGLKPIIAAEKLEVEGRVFYDASKIRVNLGNPVEWAKIKQYARFDGDDALSLFDLMSPPFFYLTQSVPKSFQLMMLSASGSQINSVMMRSYLQEGHSLPKASEAVPYEGAISFGNPGIYRNVFKVDVASLYPNVMLQYEVFDKDKDPNENFLKLVKTFTERRLKHKKLAKTDKYYDDLQNAEKIFINSCYGFLGATGLLFNSPTRAAYVTECGRSILQRSIAWAEAKHFRMVNADTDSISFCAASDDGGQGFTEVFRRELLGELNALFPELIRFEDDGFYPTVLVIKAKNYVLFDGKKLKYKGSALKATTKEPALQEFIQKVIGVLTQKTSDTEKALHEELKKIYDTFAHEIQNITDIKRWATRKTITEKVLNASRTNEQRVKDAIAGTEYVEGDRAYFFFLPDGTQCLIENFTGDYNREKLFEKLYKTAEIFDTILPVKTLFPNYKLKRNKALLENLALF